MRDGVFGGVRGGLNCVGTWNRNEAECVMEDLPFDRKVYPGGSKG